MKQCRVEARNFGVDRRRDGGPPADDDEGEELLESLLGDVRKSGALEPLVDFVPKRRDATSSSTNATPHRNEVS